MWTPLSWVNSFPNVIRTRHALQVFYHDVWHVGNFITNLLHCINASSISSSTCVCFHEVILPLVICSFLSRILELKNELVNLECSEFQFLDDLILDMKLTPVSSPVVPGTISTEMFTLRGLTCPLQGMHRHVSCII